MMKLFVLLAFCLVSLGACTAARPLPSGDDGFTLETGVEYKLGPGDKVRINVFNDESLSGEFMVSNSGMVVLPLIGEVKAGGLTPAGLLTALTEQISSVRLVRDPRITIDVIEYRPFYILGEVNSPGKYPYGIGLTVTKAVATAGGFTYRADERVAYLTREGQTTETAIPITAATRINPGDTLRIAQRIF